MRHPIFPVVFVSHPQLACLQFNEVNLSVTKPSLKKKTTLMSHLPACPSAAWSANRDRYHQTSGGFSPRGRFKKNWGKNARQRLQLGKGMGNRKNWKLEKYSDLLEYNVSNSVQQQL